MTTDNQYWAMSYHPEGMPNQENFKLAGREAPFFIQST